MATVAVAGATGFVGRAVVRELLARRLRVRALARDAAKARAVLSPPADGSLAVVVGDVFDPPRAADLVHGADAVVNCIGIIRESGLATFQRLHVDAVRALVDAASAAGARRLVHVSALAAADAARTEYLRSKFAGELVIRTSGLDWTILRPGLIHGPDGEFTRLAADWCRGRRPPYFFLPYFRRRIPGINPAGGPMGYEDPRVAPVSVDDVARAVAESLVRPDAVGEVYNLVGAETLTWPQMLVFVREHLPRASLELEPRGIPADLAALLARCAGAVGLGALLPFDEGMAIMGGEHATANTTKARIHLGFNPAGFREKAAGYLPSM